MLNNLIPNLLDFVTLIKNGALCSGNSYSAYCNWLPWKPKSLIKFLLVNLNSANVT